MASWEEIQRAIDLLPAKTPRALLTEMLSLRSRKKKGEKITVPLAVFHLKSGRDVVGWLLDGDIDGREPALLIQLTADRGPSPDVVYVDPSLVEAITIRDTQTVAKEISFGRVTAEPGAPAPGKLAIQRRLPAISEEVSKAAGSPIAVDIAWEGIADLPETRRVLLEMLEDVGSVLREIAASEIGRESLAPKVKRVWIGDGPRAGVAFQSDTLVVTANFAQGAEGRLVRGALRIETEKLL